MKLLLSLCGVLIALTLAPFASAQAGRQQRLVVSPNYLEAGQPFRVELTGESATSRDAATDPSLELPAGLQVQSGPGVSNAWEVQMGSAGFQKRQTTSLTWLIVASKPGKYTIGPGRFQLGDRSIDGAAVQVEVFPEGARPRRRRRDPFGGFPDPFGGLGRGFPSLLPRNTPLAPPAPEAAQIERAPDSRAFLRIVATPKQAVVGEQVQVRIFAYGQGGPFQVSNMEEPERPGFVAMPLAEPSALQDLKSLEIEGELWYVAEISNTAMFPLRSGELTIGSVSAEIDGVGYRSRRQGRLKRRAAGVTIHVTEPPAEGRPAGYQIGDVGNYTLSAQVSPTRGAVGESIAVTAQLAGRGNLPPSLKVPYQNGVEWLEPTIAESLAPQGDAIAGWRQFVYLVRLKEEGDIDLGELTLPYWNPELNEYEVAKARLGHVRVRAGSDDSSAALPREGLDLLGPPRTALTPMPAITKPWTEQAWYWALVFGAPLTVGLVWAASALSSRPRRESDRGRVGRSHVRAEIARAKAAARLGNAADAASGAERAVHHAIEIALGVNARGMLRTELEQSLRNHGVADPTARSACHVLETAEAARYTGASNAAQSDNFEWIDEAARAVSALLAMKGVKRVKRARRAEPK